MRAMEKWLVLPESLREDVLANMRVDYESFLGQGPEDDDYPGEGKLRAAAIALAMEALGGSTEWTK